MKRVLIVKTSSMGDVIHTLPALTDAKAAISSIQFDWVVEPSFAEIPKWHIAVNNVIPGSIRRWRKTPWQAIKTGEWQNFINQLRQRHYDLVIDAQGLLKSAVITLFAKGSSVGFDHTSARGGHATFLYNRKIKVPQGLHAVEKVRHLFAYALGYALPTSPPDYGIDRDRLTPMSYGQNTIILLHGTTWTTKHWPENYWQQLGYLAAKAGYQVILPWGSEREKERAHEIRNYCLTKAVTCVPTVLPKLSLGEITSLIANAKGIVAVDTGLGHIAAAMAVPTISLYGPTDPGLTGAYGPHQHHLRVDFPCAPCFGRACQKGQNFAINPPCFESLPPEKVWQHLLNVMAAPEI